MFLGLKRRTDGELLPVGTVPEVFATWVSDDYFRYHTAE